MRVDLFGGTVELRERCRNLVDRGLERLGPSVHGSRSPTVCVVIVAPDADPLDCFGRHRMADCRNLVLAPDRCLAADLAIRLMEQGANDILAGLPIDKLCAELVCRLVRLDAIDRRVTSSAVQSRAVGESACWISVLRRVVEVAAYSSAACLLIGESGCGKEVLARLVHELTESRSGGAWVVVDCTTLRQELAGSELFGHAKGAFTNAVSARDGAVAQAHKGTLFIDEIGELDLGLQAQLLRLIQERVYKRVGEDHWRTSDFRLVCATHRNLEADVAAGRFRHDLYFRISQAVVHVPALRERRGDVIVLARHFLREACGRIDVPRLAPEVAAVLERLPYPGNVRELRNLIQAMVASQREASLISLGALPAEYRGGLLPRSTSAGWSEGLRSSIQIAVQSGRGLREIGQLAEEMAIEAATAQCDGSVTRAAERLGVTPRALQLRRADGRRLKLAEPGVTAAEVASVRPGADPVAPAA